MKIKNYSFKGFYNREAINVENKIVYFGEHHNNITFVLEKEEEADRLKVVRKD